MRGSLISARASVALVSTAVSLVLVLSFKTPEPTQPRGPVAVLPSPASGESPSAGGGAAASPAPPMSAPSPSPSPPGVRYKDGQYTGQDFQTDFGDNQVKVIISAGRIVDVQALQLPFDRQRSAYISQVAGPLLHDEALKAQSAQIDTVSGATFTSDAYAQSLQSALDHAHV
jgi:uncharacterized protein with FMN-binding domain